MSRCDDHGHTVFQVMGDSEGSYMKKGSLIIDKTVDSLNCQTMNPIEAATKSKKKLYTYYFFNKLLNQKI